MSVLPSLWSGASPVGTRTSGSSALRRSTLHSNRTNFGGGRFFKTTQVHTTVCKPRPLRCQHASQFGSFHVEVANPTATASAAAPADVDAPVPCVTSEVRYTLPSDDKLYLNVSKSVLEDWDTNLQCVDVAVPIFDARPLIGRTSLDREGFEIHVKDSAVTSWDDEDEVRSVFYSEAVELVKRATGAKHAFVFDHTFRRVDTSSPGRPTARDPVQGVHMDYSTESAEKRLADYFGGNVLKYGGRFSIVNLWRPIIDVVYDKPLAFIDATTVKPEDCSVYDLVYPDRVGQNQTIHPNATSHKWYYLPQQKGNEVFLFKQFDSDKTKTQWVPHSAFVDPTAPPAGTFQTRESIELRIFVFHDSDEDQVKKLQAQEE